MLRPFLVCCLLLAIAATGCGAGSLPSDGGVVVATVPPTAEVVVQASVPEGGKPAQAEPATSATPPPTSAGQATPTATTGASQEGRPASGRWIDVDVTRYQVLLMEGTRVVQSIGPVAVGAQINTGAYESTQTGLFHVYAKTETLAYDAPYKTYISHWIGFDLARANGFHSFLKDSNGKVVDASTGKVSNGCVRTGAPEAIFSFAEIGMPVFVHL